MRKRLTHNLGLKILAVVFSVALWFVVNNISDPMESKTYSNIQVEILNADLISDAGKVYEVLENTDKITVKVTGKSSVIDLLEKEDIRAVADMADLSFMNTVTIKISSARYNQQLEFDSSIENLKLSIEDLKKIQMVINTSTSGQPADGYIVGTVTPSQNIVRISGPESVIDRIDHVDAIAEVRDTYTSDINTSVELKLKDENNDVIQSSAVEMNITNIDVAVSILATKEIPLKFAVSGTPADGYVATGTVISDPATIKIAGKKGLIDGISELSIADASLNLSNCEEDLVSIINVSRHLPNGIQMADKGFSGDVSVTVDVEPTVTKTYHIPAKNFGISNSPEGFNVTIQEFMDGSETYTIALVGLAEDVNQLNARSIIGVVDMDVIKQKYGLTDWQRGIYVTDIIFDLPEGVSLKEKCRMTLIVTEQVTEEEAGEVNELEEVEE
ncbi:MAG: hypothetical protein IJ326_05865 [Lachnospiraceae bacterium]|nr:hypothetical protein [Lachnospiraceae bacterium]